MNKILEHCLYPIGSKITVTDRIKHRILPANSTCFMSRFRGSVGAAPNTMIIDLIVTKKGKRGKPRCESMSVATVIFRIEMEKRPLQTDKYHGHPVVELQRIPHLSNSVVGIPPMDFLGWAHACERYLGVLFSNSGIHGKWPRGQQHAINGIKHISSKMEKHPEDTIAALTAEGFRLAFVDQFRVMEVGVIQGLIEERIDVCEAKLKALAYLIWANTKSKEKWYSERLLFNSYKYYRAELIAEKNLYYQIRMRRFSSFPKSKRSKMMSLPEPESVGDVKYIKKILKLAIDTSIKPSFNNIIYPSSESEPAKAYYYAGGNNEMFSEEEEGA